MKLTREQLREYARRHPELAARVPELLALLSPARPSGPRPLSPGEEAFARDLTAAGVVFEREYTFAPPRKWRFDFAFIAHRVAVEIEGGLYGGRHTRPEGYKGDLAKYNAATALDWRLLRYTTREAVSGEAATAVLAILRKRE